MRQGRWLVVALGWALLPPLTAAGGDITIGTKGSYPLSDGFTYLEDPDQKLSLDAVLQPAQQARFQPMSGTGAGANFGFRRAAIWLRVTLRTAADAPSDWLLELAYPLLAHVELYTPTGSGYQRQETGDRLSFSARLIPHRNFVLPVTLASGAATTVYIRLQSDAAVSAPVRLWQPGALWQHDKAAYAALGLYFGLVGGMALFQAAQTGLGSEFLWPGQLWWGAHSAQVGTVVAATFGLLFARSFLSSAARTPWIDKLILCCRRADSWSRWRWRWPSPTGWLRT